MLTNTVINRLKLLIIGEHYVTIEGINDMGQATERLAQYLKESKLSINACVSEHLK